MGHLREKYTKSYFLREDQYGNPTPYGVMGEDEFRKGGIREIDRDILRRLDFKGKTVLDIGFGRGEAIKFAVDNGAAKVVGVDFSEEAHGIAGAFLRKYEVKADLYCDDAVTFLRSYSATLREGKFDIVLMLDFVEHVPRKELREVLMLLRECLAPTAVVAINTPVYPFDNDVFSDGLDRSAADPSDDREETAGMHCNRYTRASLQDYMRSSGFKAVSGHFFVPRLRIPRAVEGTKVAWLTARVAGYPVRVSSFLRGESFEHVSRRDDKSREALDNRGVPLPAFLKRLLRGILPVRLQVVAVALFLRLRRGILNTRPSQRTGECPQWVQVRGGPLKGYTLLLDESSAGYGQKQMAEGIYDSFICQATKEYGGVEGATVWDVGAHVGYHSLAFAALVGPSGRVVAFEPNPHNVARLRQNLERNPGLKGRVSVVTAALSNSDGEASFLFASVVDDGRSSGSHLKAALAPEEETSYEGFNESSVTTVQADTLLRAKQVAPPSILKIDVEGAEHMVLEGAIELLSTQKPLLFIEVHCVTAMFHVQRILLNQGYVTWLLDTEHSSVSRCFLMARPDEVTH